MSLNGLDSPEVQAAYQTVVAEAAGWFLLKYVSRDGVELLARGRNGVSEARNAITAYTQASPLYGLMIYRRRRTLIKYIPEGTSRLLQARTSVHFQDILERYSPYETLLEITTGEALNDTALAKTFQLHTASPSPSVGRLDEITEDGEDADAEVGSLASANASTSSLSGAQRYKAARRADNLSKRAERAERSAATLQVSGATPPSLSQRLTPPAAPATLEPGRPQSLERENSGQSANAEKEPETNDTSSSKGTETEPSAASPETRDLQDNAPEKAVEDPVQPTETDRASKDSASDEPAPLDKTTTSTPEPETPQAEVTEARQSEDPPVSEASLSVRGVSMDDDPYDLSKYDSFFKPKVKLGPRPVTTAERAMRPGAARVSAVPANFRHAKKQEQFRPKSQGGQDAMTPPANAPAQSDPASRLPPPPIPVEYSPRPYSRGSVKSAPSHRASAMTPDRLRLQKAVELRKRQMRKSQEPSSFIAPVEDDPPAMPRLQLHTVSEPLTATLANQAQRRDAETERSNTDDESHPQSSKADSGIEIRYDTPSVDDPDEAPPLRDVPIVVNDTQLGASDELLTPALSSVVSEPTRQDDGSDSAEDARSLMNSHTPTQSNHEIADVTSDIPAARPADHAESAISEDGPLPEADGLAQTPSSDTLRTAGPESRPASSDLTRRRRGLVEPLHIQMPSGNPDDFMSDDDFLEELHSATVQEARPIFVAHQPSMEDISAVRSVSITRNLSGRHSNAEHLSPQASPALLSSSPSEKGDSAWNAPRKVSSGISKRIQALNEVSTREANASGYNAPLSPLTPDSASNTFLHRDHKSRGPRKAPSPAARPVSFRRGSKTGTTGQATTATSQMESPPTWSVRHDPLTSRNSVSVTARIVRPRTEPDQEQLMESELTINRDRNQTNPNLPPIDIGAAQDSNVSSPALSPSSQGTADARGLHSSSSRFGRRGRPVTSPATPEMVDFPAPPHQAASSASINDENGTPKMGTRTSRFFKRVSTFSGPKKRRSEQSVMETASVVSLESGTGTKNNRASVATHQSDTPPAVVVGDLNVQFPDSLLWKRRIVTINDQGHLQFAIAHAMEIHKGVALKSFPLSQFNAPYAPDLDRQELANSVMLELQDGTTLQLACEDAMTQRQVLHLVRSYWKSWAAV